MVLWHFEILTAHSLDAAAYSLSFTARLDRREASRSCREATITEESK